MTQICVTGPQYVNEHPTDSVIRHDTRPYAQFYLVTAYRDGSDTVEQKIIIALLAIQVTGTHTVLIYFSTSTCISGGTGRRKLVEALRYKLGGRWFYSRLCHWNFSLT
jgi:hypothetical protein